MKKILLLLSMFVLTACLNSGGYVAVNGTEFYELTDAGESFFFNYPSGGEVSELDGLYLMNYRDCSVNFGRGLNYQVQQGESFDIKTREDNGIFYQAWYKDGLLVRYGGEVGVHKFWLSDFETGVSGCLNVLETMTESITDKPYYNNTKFGYRVEVLSDFDVEYLSGEAGVIMRKNVTAEGEEGEVIPYVVEITVSAEENMQEYRNLADFIAEKYSGYSAEFVSHGGNAGVLIDEGSGDDAVRHYFMMDEDAVNIYEAVLKVPSVYYSSHKGGFDQFIKTFSF